MVVEDHIVSFAELAKADLVLDAVYAGGSAGNMSDDPLSSTGACEVTRHSRDDGRDAVGEYLLGPAGDRVAVEFALEAKCYALGKSVGVKDVARLISRIRHRQFGVVVTTSHFNAQVYKEVRDDAHPIIGVCARDITDALRTHGHGDAQAVPAWLDHRFPASA